ncbi:hypothetical protein [Sphingomonas sp.]|nr:hypothetical protein [Sphingomonas sp.]
MRLGMAIRWQTISDLNDPRKQQHRSFPLIDTRAAMLPVRRMTGAD